MRVLLASLLLACSASTSTPGPGAAGDGPTRPMRDGAPGALPDAPPAPPPPPCPAGEPASGPDATVPGAITTPHPTLTNATLEWAITGDADADGVVSVRYRRKGEGVFVAGMPLRRIPAGSNEGFSWGNRHSGSLFDLAPATAYEVELHLRDADGGCAIRTVELTTRAVPAPMPGAPVKAATPSSLEEVVAAARPGDILELGAGTYGGLSFPSDGEPGRPIVLRSAGGAVIDGDLGLFDRKHVLVTGLEIHGRVRLNGATQVAVTRCTIQTTSDGITASLRAEDLYIADNVVTGATRWSESALGVDGDNIGEGIAVTGPGHVIEHNRVSGFRDALSLYEGGEAVDQHSIDFIENDVAVAGDDGVEADFCQHNCRIVRNRLTDTFVALSSQPGLGGPTYFIRNVAYGVILSPFKLNRGSVGDVALHNTVIKNGDALSIHSGVPHLRQYFRNNLLLGGPGGTFGPWDSGPGAVIDMPDADPSGDYDHDGLGSTTREFRGRIGDVAFGSLAELRAGTTERHAVEVALSVFAAMVAYPMSPFPAHEPPDLRLAPGSAAIDAGERIPGINDAHAGSAPDLGALELGAPVPHYGPR